jgi:hypothetical protein
MKTGRYTWNRRSLLKDYVDGSWNINHKGQQVLNKFYRFKALLEETGGIHGTTHGGRKFHMWYHEEERKNKYGNGKYTVTKLGVNIFEPDGAMYKPYTCFSDAMNYSILSSVNKYETNFFYTGRNLNRLEANLIFVKGTWKGHDFDVNLDVATNGFRGTFLWKDDEKDLSFNVVVPSHIPKEQWHRFRVRSLCSPDILINYIFDMIKQNYMECCGESIKTGDRFCKKCGAEFSMGDLEITDVRDEQKETIIT